jgi:GH18 family chitinase
MTFKSFLGYENTKSLGEKTKFIREQCLGGFSISVTRNEKYFSKNYQY